jgi:hypothetical protein
MYRYILILALLVSVAGCADAAGPGWHEIVLKRGLVCLPARGGADVGYYLVDTGCQGWMFDKKTFLGKIKTDASGKEVPVIDLVNDRYPGLPFGVRDIKHFGIDDLGKISDRMKIKIIAVAGWPALRDHLIQIDYANSRMRDIPRRQLASENLGEKWTIYEKDGFLFSDLKLGGKDSVPVVVDTGAANFALIGAVDKEKFGWSKGVFEEKIHLATMYGDQDGFSFSPTQLNINGTKFDRPTIQVDLDLGKGITHNSLGAAFFSKYVLTMDVKEMAMYLKPAISLKPTTAETPTTAATKK